MSTNKFQRSFFWQIQIVNCSCNEWEWHIQNKIKATKLESLWSCLHACVQLPQDQLQTIRLEKKVKILYISNSNACFIFTLWNVLSFMLKMTFSFLNKRKVLELKGKKKLSLLFFIFFFSFLSFGWLEVGVQRAFVMLPGWQAGTFNKIDRRARARKINARAQLSVRVSSHTILFSSHFLHSLLCRYLFSLFPICFFILFTFFISLCV